MERNDIEFFTQSKFGISTQLDTFFIGHVASVDTRRCTQARTHGSRVVIDDVLFCYDSQENGGEGASQARSCVSKIGANFEKSDELFLDRTGQKRLATSMKGAGEDMYWQP